MRFMKRVIFAIALLFILSSCTDNEMARRYGGTETITLLPNEKFINVTWKQDDIWIIVQDTVTGDYIAREKSSLRNQRNNLSDMLGKRLTDLISVSVQLNELPVNSGHFGSPSLIVGGFYTVIDVEGSNSWIIDDCGCKISSGSSRFLLP